MTQQETKQHQEFNQAKKIALNIEKGCFKRARFEGDVTPYVGYKTKEGRMFVIADSLNYLKNPDATIDGKPAREIFENFSVMFK